MNVLYDPVNFTFELVEDHLKYFFKNYKKHTYWRKNYFGVRQLQYTPFIFEVKLRESYQSDENAIYKKIKISIEKDCFLGINSGYREKNKTFTFRVYSADFEINMRARGAFCQNASQMKNIRGKVEMLYPIYSYFIEPNLKDGDKKFHIDCISSPYNEEEGFGFKEVA